MISTDAPGWLGVVRFVSAPQGGRLIERHADGSVWTVYRPPRRTRQREERR